MYEKTVVLLVHDSCREIASEGFSKANAVFMLILRKAKRRLVTFLWVITPSNVPFNPGICKIQYVERLEILSLPGQLMGVIVIAKPP